MPHFFLLCTQRQSRDRSHLRAQQPAAAASPAAAESEAISVPVCSGVIDRNYAPPSSACRGGKKENKRKNKKEHPNSFDSSMRAIHDVSSGRLHIGAMKAFLRGSIRANWPSWINRGGGAERIRQTSPHLCEMSMEGAPRSGITSQRIKHVQSAFGFTSRCRPASSSRRYPHFITLSGPPTHPPTPNLPPDLPSSLSPSQTPDSLPCQWINRKALCDGVGTACPDYTPTSC